MLSKHLTALDIAYFVVLILFLSRDQLTFVVQKKDDPTDQLLVFFPKDTSVGVKPLRV